MGMTGAPHTGPCGGSAKCPLVRGHGGNHPCHQGVRTDSTSSNPTRPIKGQNSGPLPGSHQGSSWPVGDPGGPVTAAVRVRWPPHLLPCFSRGVGGRGVVTHLVPSTERLLKGPVPEFVPPASAPDRARQWPRSDHVQRGQETLEGERAARVMHATHPWGLTVAEHGTASGDGGPQVGMPMDTGPSGSAQPWLENDGSHCGGRESRCPPPGRKG